MLYLVTILSLVVGSQDSGRKTLRGHPTVVQDLAVHAKGKYFASCSADKTVKLWDLKERKLLWTAKGHTDAVNRIAFHPTHECVASASRDGTIKIWDLKTGKEIRTLKGHEGSVQALAFHPNGKILATGGADKTIRFWHVKTGELVRTLIGHESSVNALVFTPDGERLISGGGDRTLRSWGALSGKEAGVLFKGSQGYLFVYSLSISPDGKLVAVGGKGTGVLLLDAEKGVQVLRLKAGSTLMSIAFDSRGTMVAAGVYSKVQLVGVKEKMILHTFEGKLGRVFSVAFTPDGKTLLSGNAKGNIHFLKVPEQFGETIASINGWRLVVIYRLKGSRSEGQYGTLFYDGKAREHGRLGELIDTPLGKMRFYGTVAEVPWATTGWHFADPKKIKKLSPTK